jgi:hypothetical protein
LISQNLSNLLAGWGDPSVAVASYKVVACINFSATFGLEISEMAIILYFLSEGCMCLHVQYLCIGTKLKLLLSFLAVGLTVLCLIVHSSRTASEGWSFLRGGGAPVSLAEALETHEEDVPDIHEREPSASPSGGPRSVHWWVPAVKGKGGTSSLSFPY